MFQDVLLQTAMSHPSQRAMPPAGSEYLVQGVEAVPNAASDDCCGKEIPPCGGWCWRWRPDRHKLRVGNHQPRLLSLSLIVLPIPRNRQHPSALWSMGGCVFGTVEGILNLIGCEAFGLEECN